MVVDRLIKIAYFILTITAMTIFGITKLFMREFFKYHGIPKEIIIDRDCKFIINFWTTLFTLCGIKIKLSLA